MFSAQEFAFAHERREASSLELVSDNVLDIAGGRAVRTVPGMWANYAIGLGTREIVEDDIERVVEFFHDSGLPATIVTSPYAHPSLFEISGRYGFRLKDSLIVLYRDLGQLPKRTVPVGYVVREIDTKIPAEVQAVVDLDAEAFVTNDRDRSVQREITQRLLSVERHGAVAVEWQGRYVGAGLLDVWNDQGYAFAGNVQPGHRRKGLHAALIAQRAVCARARGCDYLAVMSQPGGITERNARRLGFELAYTRLGLVLDPAM